LRYFEASSLSSSTPEATRAVSRPYFEYERRIISLTGTDSDIHSAMMSRAPDSAVSASGTCSETYEAASFSGLLDLQENIASARGSSPFSLATDARVRRLGR